MIILISNKIAKTIMNNNKTTTIAFGKKTTAVLFAFAMLLSLTLISCDLDTSSNGKLDGYWRVVSIDTVETGGTMHLDDRLIFWAVQNKLLQFYDRELKTRSYILRFEKINSKWRLYEPRYHKAQSEDIDVENPEAMKIYGMWNTDQTYEILSLGSDKMILESEGIRLNFKRY